MKRDTAPLRPVNPAKGYQRKPHKRKAYRSDPDFRRQLRAMFDHCRLISIKSSTVGMTPDELAELRQRKHEYESALGLSEGEMEGISPQPLNAPSHSPVNMMIPEPEKDPRIIRLVPSQARAEIKRKHQNVWDQTAAAWTWLVENDPEKKEDLLQAHLKMCGYWDNKLEKYVPGKLDQDITNEVRRYLTMGGLEPGPPGLTVGTFKKGTNKRTPNRPPTSKPRQSKTPNPYQGPPEERDRRNKVHGQAVRHTVAGGGVLDETRQVRDRQYRDRVKAEAAEQRELERELHRRTIEDNWRALKQLAEAGDLHAQRVLEQYRYEFGRRRASAVTVKAQQTQQADKRGTKKFAALLADKDEELQELLS